MADIENTLAVAKDSHVIVYNAPNDETGQTELDEYTTIANQDRADTISSSWGTCENDVTAGYVQAENTVFEQMAFQGQSMFGSSGDTGAFGCIRIDGTTIVDQGDPSSQPWVTSVGGTSLESDNPGTNPNPGPPAKGTETVWNVRNLCSQRAGRPEQRQPGRFLLVRRLGRRRRRIQPVLGPAVLPAGAGREQLVRDVRQRHDELLARRDGDPVPPGA